jgi:hypothetical protein
MPRYEVIESKRWQNNAGRTASIYGAAPYLSQSQRVAEEWQIVTVGYTVRNLSDGTVGIGRVPWTTREEAQAWVDKHATV